MHFFIKRRLQHPEIILPLPDTRLAVLDGVLRAVVEAGIAVSAVTVPFRATVLQGDVLQRADTHTLAARDAGVGAAERLVGDPLVEAFPDDVGLEARKDAPPHLRHGLPFGDVGDNFRQMRLGHLDLTLCHLRLVDAEARHVDVGVGHLEAVVGVQRQSDFRQLLTENLFRHPAVVAAGDRHPHVGWRLRKLQLLRKLQYEVRRLPRVNREDESHPLAFRKGVFETVFALGFGNENELVIKRLRDVFGNKTAVAATREVEYHNDEVFWVGKNMIFPQASDCQSGTFTESHY